MDIIPPSTFISINLTNACKVLTTVQHTNESSKLLENTKKKKRKSYVYYWTPSKIKQDIRGENTD